MELWSFLSLTFAQAALLFVHAKGDESINSKPLSKYASGVIEKLEKELAASKSKSGKTSGTEGESLRKEALAFFDKYKLDTSSLFREDARFSTGTLRTEEIGYESNFQLNLYQLAIYKYNISAAKVFRLLDKKLSPSCRILQPKCVQGSFRTFDGSCNNLASPLWGAIETPFLRSLPVDYEDNLQEPRGGFANSKLPSPREISTLLHSDNPVDDRRVTHLVPAFAEFLEHDMILSPAADRLCCSKETDGLDCFPINIPATDPFFSKVQQRPSCLRYTRSTPHCFPGQSGIREQFNMQSAYIDLSSLYGSDYDRAGDVRSLTKGRLRTSTNNSLLLPTVAQLEKERGRQVHRRGKFLGGDDRLNSRPVLLALQTLFLREHNRIAGELEKRRPSWSDEELFQNSRRIAIAQMQNIVYDQFLRVILGPELMRKYGLGIAKEYSTYESSVNAAITNEFATAAVRFGPSLLSGVVKKYRGSECIGSYQLKDNWFDSKEIENDDWDGLNTIIGGLIQQPSQATGRHYPEALTNFLFRVLPEEHGEDIVARDIQRGRDNGLPGYNEYRKLCNLPSVTNWTVKPDEFSKSTWDRLEMVYQYPHDIDLFTGAISEFPLPGGLMGPVFACIFGSQFQKSKNGDRFFFTHAGQAGSFTPEQMANIKKRTLGDIICENSEVAFVTKNVFMIPSLENCKVPCDDPTRNGINFDLFSN